MGNLGKSFALILILTMFISSPITLKPELALAQTTTPTPSPKVTPSSNPTLPTPTPTPSNTPPLPTPTPVYPKPAIPEFTVKFIDDSYYTPITYSIDPYTNQNVTHPSYYVANKTIIVSIKNQPFVSTYDSSSGWNTSLFYNIRIKGHYVENWTNLYLVDDLPTKSNSDYTIFSYVSEQPNCENTFILGDFMTDFPVGAKVDFQVEAMNGYVHRVFNPNATNQLEMYPYEFTGEESPWSSIQTIIININDATTLYNSPSPTPTVPEFPLIAIPMLLSILSVAVILSLKKKRRCEQ